MSNSSSIHFLYLPSASLSPFFHSLQDSVRTTTTLTTLNGSSGNGGAAGAGGRNSQRLQRGSLGSSHATLLSTQSRSRQDLLATRVTAVDGVAGMAGAIGVGVALPHPHQPPHRTLQTQISQLSSVGDAHSLLEADLQWPEEQYELAARHKCSHAVNLPNLAQPTMGAIDELSCQSSAPLDQSLSRSRLKLTRIIRHSQPQSLPQSLPQTLPQSPKAASSGKVRKAKTKAMKTSNALKDLRAKLNWRDRHKGQEAGGAGAGGVAKEQQQVKLPSGALVDRVLY